MKPTPKEFCTGTLNRRTSSSILKRRCKALRFSTSASRAAPGSMSHPESERRTIRYITPEQAGLLNARRTSGRTLCDWYCAVRMLGGRPPFFANSAAELLRHTDSSSARVAQSRCRRPPVLDHLLQRLLRKDRATATNRRSGSRISRRW